MKDKDLFDLVAAMTTTVDELQTTVGELEESQLAMKAEQEKFINGLDDKIQASVSDGIGNGLDEAKANINAYIEYCRRLNNSLTARHEELDEKAAEVDSKARKLLFRAQVLCTIFLAATAAFGTALWLSIHAVQTALDAANESVAKAANYIEQINTQFDLKLNPPVTTSGDQVAVVLNGIGGLLAVILVVVITAWIVMAILNGKGKI